MQVIAHLSLVADLLFHNKEGENTDRLVQGKALDRAVSIRVECSIHE